MSFIAEIALTGGLELTESVQAWLTAVSSQAWPAQRGLSALDIYRPVGGTQDPYNKDERPPLVILVVEFQAVDALGAAVPVLEQGLAKLPAAVTATVTAMERRFYPVAGETAPGALRAPFSYVVRYHRPAEDEAAFVKHYVADHPRLEAQFPGIRSIMCYFPQPEPASRRFPRVDYMIGNEVVFDSIEDFNAAMQSPVRHDMRAHFHSFPKFSGPVTHFAMRRERVAG
jgi:uncharacterized protein (TIGR02118 family)